MSVCVYVPSMFAFRTTQLDAILPRALCYVPCAAVELENCFINH